jgi:hypothetical protein
MSFAILRTSKLKTWGNIGGSLAHNFREIETPNADCSRTGLNEHSLSSTQKIKNAINERLPEKRRSDAVLCIEHLITASPDWVGWGTKAEEVFFQRSRDWLEQKYGKANVIATTIHRDETTPHLVAYVVPLDENTGRLNAKKWLGGKKLLSEMQTDFADRVKNLRLERGIENSKANHKSIRQFYSEVNEIKKSDVEPFSERPELPEKGFLESGANYGERVLEVIYSHIEDDLLQVKKENLELKKKVEEQKQEIGRFRYFEREFDSFRQYCKLFPDEGVRLNGDFRGAVKVELEKRDFQNKRAKDFDEIYKDFPCDNLNKFIKKQKIEYMKGNDQGYGQVLKAKYGFLQEEVKKGDFLEGPIASVFERDLKLEPVAITENAKIVKLVQEQNEQAKVDYYAQDELRRRSEYVERYSSSPSPSRDRDRGYEP